MGADRDTPFVIEHATADDAEAIRALAKEGRVNPTSLDWRNFLVARHPETGVIGCVQVRDAPFRTGREVKSLVVAKAFRDGSVARALLRRVIAQEDQVIWGTCDSSLAAYYERLGCEIPAPSEVPGYYRVMRGVASLIHRLARKQAPEMVIVRFVPPGRLPEASARRDDRGQDRLGKPPGTDERKRAMQ